MKNGYSGVQSFLLRRQVSIGDVFLSTVCVKALKKRYHNCVVDVATQLPETLQFNPHIRKIYPYEHFGKYDKIFDLNNTYENNPCTKISVCFLNACGIFDETDTIGDLWFDQDSADFGKTAVEGEYIIFDATQDDYTGWNWPWPTFSHRFYHKINDVHTRIKNLGFKTMIVGCNNFSHIENADVDFTGKLNIMQNISLVAQHGLVYISYHGGMAHILQAVPMPTVIYYTNHSSEHTQTLNSFLKAIHAKTDCFDCRSRLGNGVPSPWPPCYCPDLNCADTIPIDEMVNGILNQYIKFKNQINERKLQINKRN
jgi:hypothetical protein